MIPLFAKLNLKEKTEVLVLHAPESFRPEMNAISGAVKVYETTESISEIVFAVVFVQTLQQIEDAIKSIGPQMKGDTVLWFCYPKASSKKYRCEFNRDTGWYALGQYGLECVRQVAVDEDWSALRFRKTEFIKTLTRRESFALSQEGKSRTAQNKK